MREVTRTLGKFRDFFVAAPNKVFAVRDRTPSSYLMPLPKEQWIQASDLRNTESLDARSEDQCSTCYNGMLHFRHINPPTSITTDYT